MMTAITQYIYLLHNWGVGSDPGIEDGPNGRYEVCAWGDR